MSATPAVGRSVRRPDGRDKVVGAALYLDDLDVEGLWHGATVRSPHPAARIRGIDTSAVDDDPEVVVVTAADLPGPNVVKLIADDWPVLAADRVNHVGEAVALVAAPTRERARRAAESVVVDYEPLPAITTLDEALEGDPRTGGELNVLARCDVDHGDVEAALAEADVVIEGEYETGHQEHIYIEPHGAIGRVTEDGGVDVVGSLQCPYYVHKALVHVFGLPDELIRVRQATTGGGFGGKEDYPDVIAAHAGLLARAAGRPVKIVYDRHEDIVATTKRHPSRVRHRTGVMRDGTLMAMDVDVLLDGGAYTTLSPVVLSRAVLHAAGAYRCPNVRIRGRALATNTATNGAFRGFGAPQVMFAVERQMDRIGRRLGLDPFTLRERNAYRLGDVTPTGQVLEESVSALECLHAAAERSGFLEKWERYEAERKQARDDGAPRKGVGLSLFWHGSGFTGNGERRMMAKAAVRLNPGGRLEVLAASTDIGQGTESVFRQVVADAAGVPLERVSMHVPDTSEVPDSGPTVASRTVMVVGEVLSRAAAGVTKRLASDLAEQRGLSPDDVACEDGRFRGRGGKDLGSFEEVAEAWLEAHGDLVVQEEFLVRPDSTFDETTYRGDAYSSYGWGCDVVEVEVDPDTLRVRPTKVTMAADVGKAIHPVLCAGQVEGGTLQAISWGYLEEMKLDRGRYLNDRLQTYIIPTLADAPDMDTILVENPTSAGPFGAKGVGELPMDGGAPALVQAVENASGVAPERIPCTPERLLADIRAGRVVEGVPTLAGDG
ncbi:MAG: xanthine dehydrogenase family protein molybdopterin-binding subunit [Myxococcota bacterium]